MVTKNEYNKGRILPYHNTQANQGYARIHKLRSVEDRAFIQNTFDTERVAVFSNFKNSSGRNPKSFRFEGVLINILPMRRVIHRFF